jgi:hypothetical protein
MSDGATRGKILFTILFLYFGESLYNFSEEPRNQFQSNLVQVILGYNELKCVHIKG